MHAYVVADVFTDVPLEGNQLAVFTDAAGLSDERMQRTAREMNLSETVFVLPDDDRADAPRRHGTDDRWRDGADTRWRDGADARWRDGADARWRDGVDARWRDGADARWRDGVDARVRIFTPLTEIPFAGHPILGTAFVLGTRLDSPVIRLRTGAGVVAVELTRDGDQIVFGEMEQPIPTWEPFARAAELLGALGVERAELPVEAYCNGPVHVCVALESEDAVAAVAPDLTALSRLGMFGASCFAGSGSRFRTRMFAPALGIAEDPATGSAAGPLAVHLARHRRIDFGQPIELRQGQEIGRPSVLHAHVEGSRERIERVVVGGAAVIVARGEYQLG